MRTRHWLICCLVMLSTVCAAHASGSSIAELQAKGHLRIDSSFSPSEGIVPGQKVTLTLKIATDRWFTGGTRIGIPEVPGLVILQTEQFANNASETRAGQTWVIQRWTLDIYPQRAGDFIVGPIPLQLQVNAGDAGDLQGELPSPPVRISVEIPESLAEIKQWVAAPEFSVKQSFDRSLDDLEVGDAFEQEILFAASDVMAMMLPIYSVERQAGLAAYPSPAVLDNSSNRGESLASRSLRVSYVVEQAGEYVLPAREYFWWNTHSAELELVSLAETRITVAGAGTTKESAAAPPAFNWRQILALILGLAVAGAMVWLARIYLPRLPYARGAEALSGLASRWRALRKPALPTRLNPGSSAVD